MNLFSSNQIFKRYQHSPTHSCLAPYDSVNIPNVSLANVGKSKVIGWLGIETTSKTNKNITTGFYLVQTRTECLANFDKWQQEAK